ncbi:MAG: hypothetical protein RLZZ574_284 [Cyanobacteriota bacterium]|jgi:hypothetical protein
MNKKKRATIIFPDKITTEIILDDLSSKVDFEIKLK